MKPHVDVEVIISSGAAATAASVKYKKFYSADIYGCTARTDTVGPQRVVRKLVQPNTASVPHTFLLNVRKLGLERCATVIAAGCLSWLLIMRHELEQTWSAKECNRQSAAIHVRITRCTPQ